MHYDSSKLPKFKKDIFKSMIDFRAGEFLLLVVLCLFNNLIFYIMGCDIHLFAEVKKRKSFKDKLMFWKPKKWANVDKFSKNELYEEYPDEEGEFEIKREDRFYTGGRCYNLFAALAGVRSEHFNEQVVPVSSPKGLPFDISDIVKAESDRYGSDGHSHSFNTLGELMNYDWSPWGETCDSFLNEVIPKMKSLSRKYCNVRIVYFFDN